MTDERVAVEALARCTFTPGSFDKRFASDLAAYPEDHVLTVKQRDCLWSKVYRYRRQMPPICVAEAQVWREMNHERRGFELQLDGDPANAVLRLVYADWLGEHGDEPLEFCQRWIVERKAFPKLVPCGQSYSSSGATGCNYEWCFGMGVWEMFGRLPSGALYFPYHHRNRRVAERLLAHVLKLGTVKEAR